MAAKIANLRQARKHRSRIQDRAVADANAARHGQTKTERKHRAAQEELERRRLDGHRQEGADDPE